MTKVYGIVSGKKYPIFGLDGKIIKDMAIQGKFAVKKSHVLEDGTLVLDEVELLELSVVNVDD